MAETASLSPSGSTDAAWDATTRRAGFAWIIRDENSAFPLTGTGVIEDVASPLMAEALALYEGIKKAKDLGLASITLRSDCATLIRVISTKSQISELYGVLQDIKSLSSFFVSINFQQIPRSQNREADFLAKRALKASLAFFISLG
ncbi:uncharacterized protein LOC108858053 [Raphanus sativus]|uniref:Uncharacterized protein LOC108858053 n=1 Tax=Raphanus sativus TaxID=3726 RepID=A0A6J0NTT9_RAPSA|nr:uncharacterized protein LOC108858053 [Raphanus sativus]